MKQYLNVIKQEMQTLVCQVNQFVLMTGFDFKNRYQTEQNRFINYKLINIQIFNRLQYF